MGVPNISLYAVPDIPLVHPGDDLGSIITRSLEQSNESLATGDILVVAQKIVSKVENRYVTLSSVQPSDRALSIARGTIKDPRIVQIILDESVEILRQRKELIIVVHKLGYVMANAGVDESNVEQQPGHEQVLLLPQDPDASAARLRTKLNEMHRVDVGVIISDSFGRPWRNGVVGIALGSAGVPSVVNLIGKPDLYGRKMRVTEAAVADELASAASLLMGQGNEALPVVRIRGFQSSAPHRPATSLLRQKSEDLFR